jgi:hypothetical protein
MCGRKATILSFFPSSSSSSDLLPSSYFGTPILRNYFESLISYFEFLCCPVFGGGEVAHGGVIHSLQGMCCYL